MAMAPCSLALILFSCSLLADAVDVGHVDSVVVQPSGELEAQTMMRRQAPTWQAPLLSSLKEESIDCLQLSVSRVAHVCPSEMTGEEFCKSRFYVDLRGNLRPCNWFTIANKNPPNCDWDGKLQCTPTSAAEIRTQLNITRTGLPED